MKYITEQAGRSKAIAFEQNSLKTRMPFPCVNVEAKMFDKYGRELDSPTCICLTEIKIASLQDGRRKLVLLQNNTLSDPLWLKGATISDGLSFWDVVINSVSGENVYLQDSLPCNLPNNNFYLYPMYCEIVLDALELDESGYLLEIDFESLNHEIVKKEIHLFTVRSIFDTSLKGSDVSTWLSETGNTPASQGNLNQAIQSGLDCIVLKIRKRLADSELTEDDIHDGSVFKRAHLLFTVANLWMLTDEVKYDMLKKEAEEAFDGAMSSVWIDVDKTNKVEEPVSDGGIRSYDFSFGKKKVKKWKRF